MRLMFFWHRRKNLPTPSPKGKDDLQYEKLPKKLSELDDSYRMLIQELAKR